MSELKKIVLAKQFLQMSVKFNFFCEVFDVASKDKKELKDAIENEATKEILKHENIVETYRIKFDLLEG